MSVVVENWTLTCGDMAMRALVSLAQELANSSPSLRHGVLEKARRVLKCAQTDESVKEQDFLRACELLQDLVRRKPQRTLQWVQSAVQDIKSGQTLAQLSQEMRNMNLSSLTSQVAQVRDQVASGIAGAAPSESLSVDGFCIHTPLQLRLRMDQPLRVVTDLLEFNPPILLEAEDLQDFCGLLGLTPSSDSWAEVMALCGAAHLLCGDHTEALLITEKLMVNGHASAWKLAVALAAAHGGEDTSALLADAVRVCPDEDLPRLLSHFQYGPTPQPSRHPGQVPRGYAHDEHGPSFLSLELEKQLENPTPTWTGLALGEAAPQLSADEMKAWAFDALSSDRELAFALFHCAGAEPPSVGQSQISPPMPSEGLELDEEAWESPEVAAATGILVDIANASRGLEEEAAARAVEAVRLAETQIWDLADFEESPVRQNPRRSIEEAPRSAALLAVYQLCPGLEGAPPRDLAEEVLRKASASPASESLRLVRAVAGVAELNSEGATPSELALRASLVAFRAGRPVQDIAVLLVWLAPTDAVRLLESVMEDAQFSRSRCLEVIAYLRTQCGQNSASDDAQLEEVLRQAEALILLKTLMEGSSGKEHFPLRLLPGHRLIDAVATWRTELETLPSAVREAALALLDTGFDGGAG